MPLEEDEAGTRQYERVTIGRSLCVVTRFMALVSLAIHFYRLDDEKCPVSDGRSETPRHSCPCGLTALAPAAATVRAAPPCSFLHYWHYYHVMWVSIAHVLTVSVSATYQNLLHFSFLFFSVRFHLSK